MDNLERPVKVENSPEPAWASDVAAAMLRCDGHQIRHAQSRERAIAAFTTASSTFSATAGRRCCSACTRTTSISIAHGYAKVTDEAMACVLHSNVGLMHGLMGIFNAWCDRVPMLVLGATGPGRSRKAPALDRLDSHRQGPGRAAAQLHQMGRRTALTRRHRRGFPAQRADAPAARHARRSTSASMRASRNSA